MLKKTSAKKHFKLQSVINSSRWLDPSFLIDIFVADLNVKCSFLSLNFPRAAMFRRLCGNLGRHCVVADFKMNHQEATEDDFIV